MKRLYDEVYYEVLSEKFKKLRLESGRTISDVACFLNISMPGYYKYENGTREMPMSVFVDICRFYNIDYIKTFE